MYCKDLLSTAYCAFKTFSMLPEAMQGKVLHSNTVMALGEETAHSSFGLVWIRRVTHQLHSGLDDEKHASLIHKNRFIYWI